MLLQTIWDHSGWESFYEWFEDSHVEGIQDSQVIRSCIVRVNRFRLPRGLEQPLIVKQGRIVSIGNLNNSLTELKRKKSLIKDAARSATPPWTPRFYQSLQKHPK